MIDTCDICRWIPAGPATHYESARDMAMTAAVQVADLHIHYGHVEDAVVSGYQQLVAHYLRLPIEVSH